VTGRRRHPDLLGQVRLNYGRAYRCTESERAVLERITADDWRDFWGELGEVECDHNGLVSALFLFVLFTPEMPWETPTQRQKRRQKVRRLLLELANNLADDPELGLMPLDNVLAMAGHWPPDRVLYPLEAEGPSFQAVLLGLAAGIDRNDDLRNVLFAPDAVEILSLVPPPGRNPASTMRYIKRDALHLCQVFELHTGQPRQHLVSRLLRAKYCDAPRVDNTCRQWMQNADGIGAYYRANR
jgi:hypothetical protein